MMETNQANMAAGQTDPYNWPSLNRKDLMSLSTIRKLFALFPKILRLLGKDDVGFRTVKPIKTSGNLRTDDIDGMSALFDIWPQVLVTFRRETHSPGLPIYSERNICQQK